MGKNAFQSHVTSWEILPFNTDLFDQLTTKENLNFCFPPIKLDHIKNLTTAFGILNFLNLVNQILNLGIH
jgi:hypothetical protein